MRKRYFPRAMRDAPRLDPTFRPTRIQRRHVLLINPFYRKDPSGSFGKHVLTPSLALTSIAAATPAGWAVRYWDENLLQGPPPVQPFPQVVGITVHLTFARRAVALARWYRERGAAVVFGGPHVSSCPDELAPHADALVSGEGTQVWPEALADADAGRLQPLYHGDYGRAYREAPMPRRAILPRGSFLTTTSLIASRGCGNRCGFCFLSTRGLRMPYRVRDVVQVVAEFVSDGQPYGVFTDNNLGADREYLRRLCRALRPLEKIWSAAVCLDVADDPTLVRDMALAGCTGVFVGFESLSAANLEAVRKKGVRPQAYAERVCVFHDSGIQVNGSFIFGLDDDRPDVFERTVAWIEENRLECATFHILTPYPNTPLFRKLEAEARLLHRNWELYDTAHAVFQPRHMSPAALEAGYAWAYERLFSHASIWRRRPQDLRAVLPYLAMSYLYKHSNRLWAFLIRHRLTSRAWHPLVEWTRRRHVRFRRRLAEADAPAARQIEPSVFPPGV
jgi:radical SAM superfamily enzyme YgiQ (UPF0313 family)